MRRQPAAEVRDARATRWIALAAFVVAFAARMAWVLRVQSPLDAVYSDMGGYVARAEEILAHVTPADPRILALYPYGTNYLVALQFLVLGRNARLATAVLHSLLGAIPAPCMVALTRRFVPSRLAAAFMGLVVALWVPQVSFAGFFMSEIWFFGLITAQAWLAVRRWERPWGMLADGAVTAVAFVVRPQFIMTWGLITGMRALGFARNGRWRRGMRCLFWLSLPVAIAVGASAYRMHRLAGHWGLISENANINRVWAETEICTLEATWRTPNGDSWTYWFNPPSKQPHFPSDKVHIDGYIADADLLAEVRRERQRGVPWTAKLRRRFYDVSLLVAGNMPWPESNYQEPGWRPVAQRACAAALLYGVLPLALLGILLGPRNWAMAIFVANLVTPIVAAALYFGEARYHLPYDPFLLVLSFVGCREMAMRTYWALGKLRRPAMPRAAALAGS